jgi:hypothetical protein
MPSFSERYLLVVASAALSCGLAAIGACSRQQPPPAQPAPVASAAPKAPSKGAKGPFAGTYNVPQRRPVRGEEMTPEIARRAREILDANRDTEYGTEVPFEIDGQPYVGRIEEHYHEPGGPKKPWGRHRGVTVYHGD